MKHTQHGCTTGCTLQQRQLMQRALREQATPTDGPEAFKILDTELVRGILAKRGTKIGRHI